MMDSTTETEERLTELELVLFAVVACLKQKMASEFEQLGATPCEAIRKAETSWDDWLAFSHSLYKATKVED